MGLFDKLLGRSSDSKPENELTVQSTNREASSSIISRAIAERECGLRETLIKSTLRIAIQPQFWYNENAREPIKTRG